MMFIKLYTNNADLLPLLSSIVDNSLIIKSMEPAFPSPGLQFVTWHKLQMQINAKSLNCFSAVNMSRILKSSAPRLT